MQPGLQPRVARAMRQMADSESDGKKRVVFIAHNRKDAAVVRRSQSYMDAGFSFLGMMFRRDGEPEKPGPEWPNVDLGYVEHLQHGKRLLVLLKAFLTVLSHRKQICEADVLTARNLDMMLLGLAAIAFSRKKPAVIYECLDVHDAMTRQSWAGRVLRWVEKQVLKKTDLLLVSSPGFIRNYFIPVQQFQDAYVLVENKLYLREVVLPRPLSNSVSKKPSDPWVLVWVGILRCQDTLTLLKALAGACPDSVVIRLHGKISTFLIPDFLEQIAPFENIQYQGEYQWPEGLQEAYAGADFVWSQELSWRGNNSDWLLPNRIYEGTYFGALALAIAGSETGSMVEERGLGYVLEDAEPSTLIAFFKQLAFDKVLQRKQAVLKAPEHFFVTTPKEAQQVVEAAIQSRTTVV